MKTTIITLVEVEYVKDALRILEASAPSNILIENAMKLAIARDAAKRIYINAELAQKRKEKRQDVTNSSGPSK